MAHINAGNALFYKSWVVGERRAMEERRLGLCDKKGALLSKVVRPVQTSLHSMASPRKFREGAEGVRQLSLEEYVHAKAFAQIHTPSTPRDSIASEGSNTQEYGATPPLSARNPASTQRHVHYGQSMKYLPTPLSFCCTASLNQLDLDQGLKAAGSRGLATHHTPRSAGRGGSAPHSASWRVVDALKIFRAAPTPRYQLLPHTATRSALPEIWCPVLGWHLCLPSPLSHILTHPVLNTTVGAAWPCTNPQRLHPKPATSKTSRRGG
ncbi:hypothetical protein T484DRAFT_1896029, partial [Baffinella frigidus]